MSEQTVVERPASAPAAAPSAGGAPLTLHPDRFFDAEPGVRRIARTIYEETRGLPLSSIRSKPGEVRKWRPRDPVPRR